MSEKKKHKEKVEKLKERIKKIRAELRKESPLFLGRRVTHRNKKKYSRKNIRQNISDD